MPYAVLEKKLQAVPEQYFEQVSSFLDMILTLPNNNDGGGATAPSGHPVFGLAEGEFRYPEDINLHDDEVADLFGV
ncbi:MAG: hypothetical protein K6G18_09090 [Treponema sp.]|nr:hypothetical protein [Treponema sp.]